jgi:predicted GIY-YIG superfamily endonuclease
MRQSTHHLAGDSKKPRVGTVYLLHFSRPYHHARHYVGFSQRVEARIREHRRGRGSPLVEAVFNAGIEIFVARTWDDVTVAFERRLHLAGRARQYGCPICFGRRAFARWQPRRDATTGIGV